MYGKKIIEILSNPLPNTKTPIHKSDRKQITNNENSLINNRSPIFSIRKVIKKSNLNKTHRLPAITNPVFKYIIKKNIL